MVQVIVKNNDFSKALSIFRKKVSDENIIQEYREKQFYEKPSEKRKRKRAASKIRINKELRKRFKEFGY